MNRTLAIMHVLGWQGGTIHQVAKEINCSSTDIIYSDADRNHPSYKEGFYAHNHGIVNRQRTGDLAYWLGVAEAGILAYTKQQGMPCQFNGRTLEPTSV